METKNKLSISDFGRLVGIDRKTLIFYDREGILKPSLRTENGYRYYSVSQVSELCILLTLQELGLSLQQIKEVKDHRDASLMCRIFANQEPVLQGKIHQMQSSLDMLHVRHRQLNEMRNAIPGKSQITYLDEQYYYASPRCSIDKTGSYNEVWETFYEDCVSRHVSQGYPVCYVIGTESLASGNVNTAKSIAFHVEDPSLSNLRTPGGMYATGYYPVPHASSREYDAMLKMIEQSQYHVAGDSIEEIICDEVYTKNTDDFMIRISIPVQS